MYSVRILHVPFGRVNNVLESDLSFASAVHDGYDEITDRSLRSRDETA